MYILITALTTHLSFPTSGPVGCPGRGCTATSKRGTARARGEHVPEASALFINQLEVAHLDCDCDLLEESSPNIIHAFGTSRGDGYENGRCTVINDRFPSCCCLVVASRASVGDEMIEMYILSSNKTSVVG